MIEIPMNLKVMAWMGLAFLVASIFISRWLKLIFAVVPFLIGFSLITVAYSERGVIEGYGELLSFSNLKKGSGTYRVDYQDEVPFKGKFIVVSRYEIGGGVVKYKMVKDFPTTLKVGDKFFFLDGKVLLLK